MSIQRYHFYNIYGTPIPDNKVIDDNGDYVLYTAHAAEVERLTAERDAAVRERDAAVEALRRLLTLIECASNLPDEAANRIEAFGVDEGVYHASRIIGEAKAILAKIKGERG